MNRLNESITRNQFSLQLKQDIYSGILKCSLDTQCLLASYIVQCMYFINWQLATIFKLFGDLLNTISAVIGDYDSIDHESFQYLYTMNLIADQTVQMEHRISAQHKQHSGLSSDQAEIRYLEEVMKIPFYGIYFFQLNVFKKDVNFGVNSSGIVFYQNDEIILEYGWCKVIDIKRKQKELHIEIEQNSVSD